MSAPSRPSKHPARRSDIARSSPPDSPTEAMFRLSHPGAAAGVSSLSSSLLGQKMPIVAGGAGIASAVAKAAPLAMPAVPAVLVQPEEQTDNWDDDFEEGISLSKLQGLSNFSKMADVH